MQKIAKNIPGKSFIVYKSGIITYQILFAYSDAYV